jgi:3-deoxy-7-phosphoheptulonate synthase
MGITPIKICGKIIISRNKTFNIAGPCAIESKQQLFSTAKHVAKKGADALRGGAFKARTHPNSFQGLGLKGIHLLLEAGFLTKLPIVTEVLTESQIPQIISAAKKYHNHPIIWQIGSRNAQNTALLRTVGKTGKPVLLKRGFGMTIKETQSAATYITQGGSPVIICERGIRTWSNQANAGRFTPDLFAIPTLQKAGFPVIWDPSHCTGRSDWVESTALAGVAMGCNGLIVEVHPRPNKALCDGPQALTFKQYSTMMIKIKKIKPILK